MRARTPPDVSLSSYLDQRHCYSSSYIHMLIHTSVPHTFCTLLVEFLDDACHYRIMSFWISCRSRKNSCESRSGLNNFGAADIHRTSERTCRMRWGYLESNSNNSFVACGHLPPLGRQYCFT